MTLILKKELTRLLKRIPSKLAIILFNRQLAKRLGSDKNVKAFCVNPGIVCTDIYRNVFFHWINKLFMATFCLGTESGALTTIYCALEENIEFQSDFNEEVIMRQSFKCKSRSIQNVIFLVIVIESIQYLKE